MVETSTVTHPTKASVEQAARLIAEELGADFDSLPTMHFGEGFSQDNFLRAAEAVLAQREAARG